MTAQDAFAIVFDEAWGENAPKPPMTAQEAFAIAFDALPSINDPNAKLPSSKPGKSGIKKNPAAAPTAKGSGMGIGSGMSPKGEKTLAEHAEECQAKSPETCPYTRKLAKQIAAQKGISMEDAMGEATSMHVAATQQVKQLAGQQVQGMEGMQPLQAMPAPEAQPLDPKSAEQAVQQLEADPAKIPEAQGELLPQPEQVDTVLGPVTVQTTVQKAGVETLSERAADGDEEAIASLGTVKEGLSGEGGGTPAEGEVEEEKTTVEETEPVDPRFEQLADKYVNAKTDKERDAILGEVKELRKAIKQEKQGGGNWGENGNHQKIGWLDDRHTRVWEPKSKPTVSPEEQRDSGMGGQSFGEKIDEVATQRAREEYLEAAPAGTEVTLGWGRRAVKNEDGSWTLVVPKRVNGYQRPRDEYDDGGSTTDIEKRTSTRTSADIAKYSNFKVDGKSIETLVPPVIERKRDWEPLRDQKKVEKPHGEGSSTGENPPPLPGGGGGGPRKAAKKKDYLDALDKMHDARTAYDAVFSEMRKDPGGVHDKYREKIAEATKALKDAEKVVAAFEEPDVDIVGEDGKPIDTGDDRRRWAEQERAFQHIDTAAGGENPPPPPPPPPSGGNTPPETPEENPEETPPEERPAPPPPPSDDQFRKDDKRYQVGDVTYRDVSNMGLLHGMLSSFMAGLRGEDIITGWDRISGTWDNIKRSAAGEQVRSGIAGAAFLGELDKMAAKDLSTEARSSLEAVRAMFEDAATPQKQMAAIKQYRQWKKDYAEELGEEHKPSDTFPPLPNDYKGGKAPLNILRKPEGFTADKEFGEKVSKDLEERLSTIGLPVDGIESIEVGPSATTVQFKVSPAFNITKAQSKATKDALKGATGTDVTKVEYAKGKKDVISVQITNPQMRNVSFADVMHSKEWQEFSQKAALPVPLGKDASGKDLHIDIAKQPHMIVTGASGSGKSVFLASAIAGLEMAKTPDEARVVVLDPKDEFKSQDGSPHLLYPRAKETKDIASVVSNLRSLMEERISKIGGTNTEFDPAKNEYQGDSEHNIKEYNAAHPDEKPMEYVMVVFDEVAKVMKDPEYGPQVIADISQIQALGRSVGIDCILATQRNDVKSIPGEIQANAPAHLAFKASNDDAKASQEVKDLAGSGDFIMVDKEGKKTRGRACFISNEEISAVPAYYRDHMEGAPEGEVTAKPAEPETPPPEPPKEETPPAEPEEAPKKAKDMRIDFSSRESMLSSAKAIKDKEIAEADERYQKSGDLDKYEKEVQEAEEKEGRVRALADRRYPDQALADGDAEAEAELPAPAEPEPEKPAEEPKEPEWESPLARANKPENRIAAAREDYENGVKTLDAEKRKKGMSEKDYYDRLEKLEADYNKKVDQIKSGKSIREILDEEDRTAKAEEERNEALRKSVVTSTKKGPVAGAVHMLQGGRGKIQNLKPMPAMQAAAAKKNLPDGFEIDSDDRGRPLVNGMGLSYARNPKNGSYGWIDRNGGFHMKVNTADPRYKGENSQEAKDLKAKIDRSHGARKAQFEKQYRGVAFGLDEAPDGINMEILAAAVQEAISGEADTPVEG